MIKIDKEKFGLWAIVTGASSGIGKEFARQLAASGLNVVLVARRLPLLEALGRQLAQDFGIQYHAIGLDLTDENFIEKIEQVTQHLDVGLLISNAGAGNPGEFLTINEKKLLEILKLNTIAHLRLTHHFGRRMAKRGRGGILLVSAMGASQGIPYMANDGGTKAYVLSLGEALHVEFQKHGLHVTTLLPGPTETPVLAEFGFDLETMPIKPMSVEKCVNDGLIALNANRSSIVSGRLFRIMTTLLPGSVMTKMNGDMFAKVLAKKQAAGVTPVD